MSEIRIAQYFKLTTANGTPHLYQNYFINETKTFNGQSYAFVPFRAEGTSSSLGGDNQQFRVFFPSIEVIIRLVEAGQFNYLSTLEFTTAWVDAVGNPTIRPLEEYYIGIGAGYSETTVELRFRSAVDGVGSTFPARSLNRQLVGPLPLNSELYLR